jgi:hypothetical protein
MVYSDELYPDGSVMNLSDLPIEVLDRVLSQVVQKNDYRTWTSIASVSKAFADYAAQYLTFEEIKIGYDDILPLTLI